MTAEEVIRLGAWSGDAVEYILQPADSGPVRSPRGASDSPLPPDCEPRIAIPASGFDCIALDSLRDHPAVQPLIRAELDCGVPFRMLRFPLALHKPQHGRITEARYAMTLQAAKNNPARVHSIFPERIVVQRESNSEISIEPTLKIASVLEISGARLGRRIAIQQARSTTVGYWSETGAEWSLRALDDSEGLDGTWDFLAIVRWQKAVTPLRVNLALSATIASLRPATIWRARRIERNYDPVNISGCTSIS